MKKTLLLVLALIAVGCFDAEQSEQVTSLSTMSPQERSALARRIAEEANAQSLLRRMYSNDDGVPEDDAEAVRWYRLAAEQGDAMAQNKLGIMYATGDGVPEDDVEAVRWWRLAAEQGLAETQNNLGRTYALGEGVPEDWVLAYMW